MVPYELSYQANQNSSAIKTLQEMFMNKLTPSYIKFTMERTASTKRSTIYQTRPHELLALIIIVFK